MFLLFSRFETISNRILPEQPQRLHPLQDSQAGALGPKIGKEPEAARHPHHPPFHDKFHIHGTILQGTSRKILEYESLLEGLESSHQKYWALTWLIWSAGPLTSQYHPRTAAHEWGITWITTNNQEVYIQEKKMDSALLYIPYSILTGSTFPEGKTSEDWKYSSIGWRDI